MPCTHKFFGHQNHLPGVDGLLPNWPVDTLIIGTFNPENAWAPNNDAEYFYGRPRNYFWRILPRFAGEPSIHRLDVHSQIDFLQRKKIAVTDLLIEIEGADINNLEHIQLINGFLDDDVNNFAPLRWNTQRIIHYLTVNDVKAVYFTKLGGNGVFEPQMVIIEDFCHENGISVKRLHTPSGQGLGGGRPRENKLIHAWFNQAGHQFPFLSPDFDINNPQFNWN